MCSYNSITVAGFLLYSLLGLCHVLRILEDITFGLSYYIMSRTVMETLGIHSSVRDTEDYLGCFEILWMTKDPSKED